MGLAGALGFLLGGLRLGALGLDGGLLVVGPFLSVDQRGDGDFVGLRQLDEFVVLVSSYLLSWVWFLSTEKEEQERIRGKKEIALKFGSHKYRFGHVSDREHYQPPGWQVI